MPKPRKSNETILELRKLVAQLVNEHGDVAFDVLGMQANGKPYVRDVRVPVRELLNLVVKYGQNENNPLLAPNVGPGNIIVVGKRLFELQENGMFKRKRRTPLLKRALQTRNRFGPPTEEEDDE